MGYEPLVLLDGLGFPEDPRWRDDYLWFSDMDAKAVMRVDLEGNLEKVVDVEGTPSGLGWLPGGDLLVVSMADRRLLRLTDEGLVEMANMWELASFNCNDMVVNEDGRAYISNFGFDFEAMAPFATGEIITVSPNGEPMVVADELAFPNGMVITPDGKSLIVSETLGEQLTAFDLEPSGELSHRRTWATLEKMTPDGITIDAEGAVWVPSPVSKGVFRVLEGGEITDKVPLETQAYACTLGGAERKTLFITTSGPLSQLFEIMELPLEMDDVNETVGGRIEYCPVEIPGGGRP
jgi:sugar lactone lactonase YvrE